MKQDIRDEILRYAGNVHSLNPPASPEAISAMEVVLGQPIPPYYRAFLADHNGVSLFRDRYILYGVLDGSNPQGSMLYELNMRKNQYGLGGDFFLVGESVWGDVFSVAADVNSGNSTRLMLWDHELGKFGPTWDNIEAWLRDVLVVGQRSYNYDGTKRRRSAWAQFIYALGLLFRSHQRED